MIHFFTFTLFIASVRAGLNNWSVPCDNGECFYDIGAQGNGPIGTLKIWGARTAISDITPAGGYTIIDCNANQLEQDIRLVCASEDAESNCGHLYEGGAENTIVRLPESCGQGPFARVAKAWIPSDQRIPANLSAQVSKRQNTPQVKALRLDANFNAASNSSLGNVSLALFGSSFPNAQGNFSIDTTDSSTKKRDLSRRYLNKRVFGLHVPFIDDGLDALAAQNTFNESSKGTFPPIDIDKSLEIFSASLSCPQEGLVPGLDGSVKVNVGAKAHVEGDFGVVASGTLVPLQFDDIGLYATIRNTSLTGTLDIKASATGTLDTGKKPIFQVGIPGLDVPGILSIGPSFQVNAQAKASLELATDLLVDLTYSVHSASLFFPPDYKHHSSAMSAPNDTPLKLSASPSVTATGTLEAHIIPGIVFGITVGPDGSLAKADVSLDLDTSGTLSLSLTGAASASISGGSSGNTTQGNSSGSGMSHATSTRKSSNATATSSMPHATNTSNMSHAAATTSMSHLTATGNMSYATTTSSMPHATSTGNMSHAATQRLMPRVDTNTTSPTFSGCVDVGTGIDISASANAGLLGLFDVDKSVTLFSKNFDLFKKCFGDSQPARRAIATRRAVRSARSAARRAGLVCPGKNLTAPVSVVDDTIEAALIKAIGGKR